MAQSAAQQTYKDVLQRLCARQRIPERIDRSVQFTRLVTLPLHFAVFSKRYYKYELGLVLRVCLWFCGVSTHVQSVMLYTGIARLGCETVFVGQAVM